jgi:hypothetical protein
MILQHPLFDDIRATRPRLPESFSRAESTSISFRRGVRSITRTRWEKIPLGEDYRRRWIAAMVPVQSWKCMMPVAGIARTIDTGLKVLVQEDYETAIAPVHSPGRAIAAGGVVALAVVILVILAMWGVVMRAMREIRRPKNRNPASIHSIPRTDDTGLASPCTAPRRKSRGAGRGSGAEEERAREPERT